MRKILLCLVLTGCTGWMLDDSVNRPAGWKLNDPTPNDLDKQWCREHGGEWRDDRCLRKEDR